MSNAPLFLPKQPDLLTRVYSVATERTQKIKHLVAGRENMGYPGRLSTGD
jgi:hypothetical protein